MLRIKPDHVESIIREVAATEILPRFRNLQDGDISYKIGDDPVTIADKAAESALSKRLLDLLPGSKVVGEESFATNPRLLEVFSDDSPVWIVDPIDGTRNFVAGRDAFGVIIALAQRNQTIAGWLYHPSSDEFVTAETGAGAFYKGARLKVRAPESLDKMLGVFGYRIHKAFQNASETKPELLENCPLFATPSKAGCHDFPRLVIDKPHFGCDDPEQWHYRSLLQTCSPWDDAAPLMIHAEAGGYSAHWDGRAFSPTSYGYGFMAAPDKDSWEELKNWIARFCPIPEPES